MAAGINLVIRARPVWGQCSVRAHPYRGTWSSYQHYWHPPLPKRKYFLYVNLAPDANRRFTFKCSRLNIQWPISNGRQNKQNLSILFKIQSSNISEKEKEKGKRGETIHVIKRGQSKGQNNNLITRDLVHCRKGPTTHVLHKCPLYQDATIVRASRRTHGSHRGILRELTRYPSQH